MKNLVSQIGQEAEHGYWGYVALKVAEVIRMATVTRPGERMPSLDTRLLKELKKFFFDVRHSLARQGAYTPNHLLAQQGLVTMDKRFGDYTEGNADLALLYLIGLYESFSLKTRYSDDEWEDLEAVAAFLDGIGLADERNRDLSTLQLFIPETELVSLYLIEQ